MILLKKVAITMLSVNYIFL